MYSESLLIADRNTVKLMIDELRAEKAAVVVEMNAEIAAKKAELAEKNSEIAEKNSEIAEKNFEIAEKDALIQKLQKQLADAGYTNA